MNRHDSKGKALGPGDVCFLHPEPNDDGWMLLGTPVVITVEGPAVRRFGACPVCNSWGNSITATGYGNVKFCGCALTKIDPDEVAHEAEKDECLTA